MLEIRNLSTTFDVGARDRQRVVALDGVDLDVADGEFVTVVGPSGCGKTTLLRAIAGFDAPDTGTISIGGRVAFGPDGRMVAPHERGVGLVPQDGALFPHLSVAQNVGFGLSGLDHKSKRARVEETLELVGLAALGRRRPHELSGGQQQRIALARAIAPGPRLILLDEPFSALDEYLRESLRTEVRELLGAIHATTVLVTHDQAEALALGDRVVAMREGRVVQVGTPRDTYYHPMDLELARFLGEAVVIDGEVILPGSGADAGATTGADAAPAPAVSCAFGTLPVASWHGGVGRCDVLIRPENIRVSQEDASARDGDARHGLVGTILDQTFYGHDGVIRVEVPQLPDQVSVRIMGDRPFGVGDRVRLVVDRAVCTYPA